MAADWETLKKQTSRQLRRDAHFCMYQSSFFRVRSFLAEKRHSFDFLLCCVGVLCMFFIFAPMCTERLLFIFTGGMDECWIWHNRVFE
jgi:hypothetical protein